MVFVVITCVLLQKNNQSLPSKAHDATATSPGLENSASYKMDGRYTSNVLVSERFSPHFPLQAALCMAGCVFRRDVSPAHRNLNFLPFHVLG